jgi:hypothetical protein
VALTEEQITKLGWLVQRHLSKAREPNKLSKHQWPQLMGEIDAWVEANKAGFLASLSPELQPPNTTAAQLARGLMMVVRERFEPYEEERN